MGGLYLLANRGQKNSKENQFFNKGHRENSL